MAVLASLVLSGIGGNGAAQALGLSPQPAARHEPQSQEEKDRLLQTIEVLAGLTERVQLADVRVRVYGQLASIFWRVEPSRAREFLQAAVTEIEKLRPEGPAGSDREQDRQREVEQRREKLFEEVLGVAFALDPGLGDEILSRAIKSSSSALRVRAREARMEQADLIALADPERSLREAEQAVQQEVSLNLINLLVGLRAADPVAADRLMDDLMTRMAALQVPNARALALLGLYFLPQEKAPVNTILLTKYIQLLSFSVPRLLRGNPFELEDLRILREHLALYLLVLSRYGADTGAALEMILRQMGSVLPLEIKGSKPSEEGVSDDQSPLLRFRLQNEIRQALAEKNFEKAHQLIEKIPQVDERRRALDLVQATAAQEALDRGELQLAIGLVRKVDDPLQRIRLYWQVIRHCHKGPKMECDVSAFFAEADLAMGKVEASLEKLQVLTEGVSLGVDVDKFWAFQMLQSLIRILNKLWAGSPSDYRAFEHMRQVLGDVEQVFIALGRVDFDQALALAHQLDNLNLRVPMGVAVCKGAWERLAAETRKAESEAQPGSTETPSGQKKKRSANESPPGSSPVVRPPAAPPRK